jgi:glycine cleavage system aminomethyltransferase T
VEEESTGRGPRGQPATPRRAAHEQPRVAGMHARGCFSLLQVASYARMQRHPGRQQYTCMCNVRGLAV